jgi:hypothetical protein
MARPQVADGGDGLQTWRVAVNILNKQSRTAYRGRPSGVGVGQGLTTHHRKDFKSVTKCSREPRSRTHSLALPKHRITFRVAQKSVNLTCLYTLLSVK